MERILNDDDKIRRAEEIYYRRNNQVLNLETKKNNKSKNNFRLNLLIMFNLAIIVFCIQNKNFIFTKEFLGTLDNYNIVVTNKVKEIFKGIFLEESLNKENMHENILVNTIENNMDNIEKETDKNINDENLKNELNEINASQSINEIVEEGVANTKQSLSSTLNEMEEDVKNLKVAYRFINPLQGIVSSGFGARESKYQNVTGYHTGIDIAAEKGTVIKASMEGIVDLVSSKGDYGKHIKIRSNNVTTLYAHCSKIYVKQGQIVGQGDKIAEVGSTGNSTGPHLHFEIRVNDRYVDPAMIINFN